MQVSSAGGEPRPLTTPAREQGEIGHLWPHALPGGKAILFNVVSQEGLHVAVLSLETGRWHRLAAGVRPQYARSGHLLFAQGGTFFAVPFDETRLQVAGTPIAIVDKIGNYFTFGQPSGDYAVSDNGDLVCPAVRQQGQADVG